MIENFQSQEGRKAVHRQLAHKYRAEGPRDHLASSNQRVYLYDESGLAPLDTVIYGGVMPLSQGIVAPDVQASYNGSNASIALPLT